MQVNVTNDKRSIVVSVAESMDKRSELDTSTNVSLSNVMRPTSLKLEPSEIASSTSLQRLSSNMVALGQLNSPELRLLGFGNQGGGIIMTSPDIDRIIHQLSATSPQTPTSFLNPKNVTQDQEQFANAFTKKLSEIKAEHEGGIEIPVINAPVSCVVSEPQFTDISYSTSSNLYDTNNLQQLIPSSAGTQLVFLTTDANGGQHTVNLATLSSLTQSATVATLSESRPTLVPAPTAVEQSRPRSVGPPSSVGSSGDIGTSNEEKSGTGGPIRNSGSSHLSADDQHLMKLERKRARNRDAARKCRERKVSLIQQLEKEVAALTDQNKGLHSKVKTYRSEVEKLKRFVIEHVQKGCDINNHNS